MSNLRFEEGDVVKHKASSQKMVVLWSDPAGSSYNCRFLNKATGSYEVEKFRQTELTLDNKN